MNVKSKSDLHIFIEIFLSFQRSKELVCLSYLAAVPLCNGQIISSDLHKLKQISIDIHNSELNLAFLQNCKSLNVYPKFYIDLLFSCACLLMKMLNIV